MSYGFGFRCDEGGPAAIYLTPEVLENSDAANFSLVPIKVLVRVDEKPAREYEGTVDSANRKLRATASVDGDVLAEVRDASRRVAIALKITDALYHERSFSARGSTAALKKFLGNCNVSE